MWLSCNELIEEIKATMTSAKKLSVVKLNCKIVGQRFCFCAPEKIKALLLKWNYSKTTRLFFANSAENNLNF